MFTKINLPTAQELYESIFAALDEYRARHREQNPARIVMTTAAIARLTGVIYMRRDLFRYYFCGIPVDDTPGDDCHVYLAEPEITIYSRPKTEEG